MIVRRQSKRLKTKKKKGKKVTIVLSERDTRILAAVAAKEGVRCSLAAKRLLHAQLQQTELTLPEQVAANQLTIFDVVQTDIFSAPHKTKVPKAGK